MLKKMLKKKTTAKATAKKAPVKKAARKPRKVTVATPEIPEDVQAGEIVPLEAVTMGDVLEDAQPLSQFVAPLPTIEGKRVLEILDSGHTATHYHCKVEGGLTMHVPKKLF